MQEKFCQSCAMPMGNTNELYGEESDGTQSKHYCKYCYEKGEFTFQGSMQEMIDICVQPMVENNPGMTEEKAREMMQKFLPMLKRWK